MGFPSVFRCLMLVALPLPLWAQGHDATLKELRVNGTPVFPDGVGGCDFPVKLTGSPVAVPAITAATPMAPGARVTIENAPSLVRAALVRVTAEDGVTTKVYRVHFRPELQSGAIEALHKLPHPRVYLTAAQVRELRAKITSPAYAAMWQELKAQADAIVARGIVQYVNVKPSDAEELWERTVADNLTIVAFVWLVGQEPRYFDFARNQALTAITYETWGASMDLAAGHMLGGIGTVYDWLYSDLPDADRARLLRGLLAHGNEMAAAAGAGGMWWGRAYLQNHLWVNMTGLTVAGLAIAGEDRVTAAGWLRTALDKFSGSVRYLGEDGASPEGPSYWNYGVEYLLKFADLARTHYEYNLFAHPWLARTGNYKIAMFYPRQAWTAAGSNQNFGADAETVQWGGPDYLFRKLAAEYRDGVYQWYAEQVDQAGIDNPISGWLNMLWFDPTVVAVNPLQAPGSRPTSWYFPDLGILSLRSGWSGNESIISFKCGPCMGRTVADSGTAFDLGAGHVHPDANHFTIFGAGEWQLKDDGYAYKTTANHNTLLVETAGTLAGQMGEGGQWFDPGPLIAARAGPEILRRYSGRDCAGATGDGTAAYPASAGVTRFQRHLLYLRNANILIVIDDLAFPGPRLAELRFFPQSQRVVAQADGGYFVAGDKSNLRIVPLTLAGVSNFRDAVTYATREGLTAGTAEAIRLRKENARTWRNATAFIWETNDRPELPRIRLVQEALGNRWKFYTSDHAPVEFDWNTHESRQGPVSPGSTALPAATGADTSLAGLFVGGRSIAVVAGQLRYDVAVAGHPAGVPRVVVAPNDPDATISVIPARSLPGSTTVTVSSGDQAHRTSYAINLVASEFQTDGSLAVAQVTATAPADRTKTPDKAIDGIDTMPDNYFASNARQVGGVARICFDLGGVQRVNRVNIAWRLQETRTYTYDIQASSDNLNWTTVVARKSSGREPGLSGYRSDLFDPVAARYVRINGYDNSQGSGWIAIREVKLFGPGIQPSSARAGQ